MLTAELTGRNPGFSLAEDTDDLFVGKTLLHGDVLMWLMKTLLTSRCINQRGAGQFSLYIIHHRIIVRVTNVHEKLEGHTKKMCPYQAGTHKVRLFFSLSCCVLSPLSLVIPYMISTVVLVRNCEAILYKTPLAVAYD